jgi:nucleotide-binding universal stress UspA family protein
LQRARHVVVMRWNETPEAPRASGSILGLERFLKLHGVAARFDDEAPASPDLVGELMLSRCTDHGADLLVMGSYGHARLREWVLGGASRTVMRSMTLPVLMSH